MIYRMLCYIITFILFIGISPLSLAQTSRLKLKVPTGWGAEEQGGVSSFRNKGESDYGKQYEPMQGLKGLGGLGGAEGMASVLGSQYNVHVLGEVKEPGTYVVSASTRLSQAIKRSGGIASTGSERSIQLRRAGKTKTIDLIKYELLGSLSDNPYIINNDVVFVPLKEKVIQIVGAVRRPDNYELKREKNLYDAVNLAGGFSASHATDQPIKVIRFEDGNKNIIDVMDDKKALKDFSIHAGDVIFVPDVITAKNKFDFNIVSFPGEKPFYPSYEDRVFVLGGVMYPGAYPFSPYYTINQYVSLSGGISDRGAPKYKIVSINGKTRKAKADSIVNPGDTIYVKQHWMSPAAWISFVMGVASFGLSVTATTLALTK